MGQCKVQNKLTYIQSTFYREVVSCLMESKPRSRCQLPLAFHLSAIIQSYTGNEIVNNAKQCAWGMNVDEEKEKKASITRTTRRIRCLDRLVKYAHEDGYSYADIYNAIYCINPFVSQIVRINRGQEWESNDDWFIYDIYARVALLCIPNKSAEYKHEKATILLAEVERMYTVEHAAAIKKFIRFLQQQLITTNFYVGNECKTVGEAMSDCLEHFCYLGMADLENYENASVIIDTAHLILHFSLIHPKLWFNSPFTLISSAVNSAITFTGIGQYGNWYRVECRTAVRSGVTLDSNQLMLLNTGSFVHVIENFGRRVQIDQPVRGFCSLHDGAGLDILKKSQSPRLLAKLTNFSHDDLQSPFRDMTRWIFTDRTSSYRCLKAMFATEKHNQVSMSHFSNGQLVHITDESNMTD